jgi:hypothetical protein
MNIKKKLKNHLNNMSGWRTDKKVVVLESDDWGAIRMPSAEVLSKLKKSGVKTDRCHYVSNDSLASEEDLTQLFECLNKVTNKTRKKPVLTANVVMANPDFQKIRESGFKEYHFDWFTDSLKKYPKHSGSFELWKEGMRDGIFYPQFHAREHLQVSRWLAYLKDQDSETARAFHHNVFGLSTSVTNEDRRSYLAAYEVENEKQQQFVLDSICEGLRKFQNVFGFKSESAIAPNYTWNHEMEKVMVENGIRYLQGGRVQRSPDITTGTNQYIRHSLGDQNSLGQIYLVRNCTFEPSSNPSKDWVNSCLSEIKTAFFWKKPAVIESHRVNYVGYINPANRDKNLELLETLLTGILNRWPDVEFMSSDELGRLIESEQH